MNPRLKTAIDRCLKIFSDGGEPRSPQPLETDAVFELIRQRTNIVFDEDLKDFYRQFGGSDWEEYFAVEVAGPVLLALRAPDAAIEDWTDQKVENPTYEDLDLPPRDQRIQQDVVTHPGWFPLASFDSTLLYYDTAPTPQGRQGQIIVYQHDPDEIFYVADDFVSFFEQSNDLLKESWEELFE